MPAFPQLTGPPPNATDYVSTPYPHPNGSQWLYDVAANRWTPYTAPATGGGDLTSGPVTSSGGVSAIAANALSIAMTDGLSDALAGKQASGDYATTSALTSGLAGKAPSTGISPSAITGTAVTLSGSQEITGAKTFPSEGFSIIDENVYNPRPITAQADTLSYDGTTLAFSGRSDGKVPLATRVDGTLPVANGGTGATVADVALTNLGAQATGKLLLAAGTPAAARGNLGLEINKYVTNSDSPNRNNNTYLADSVLSNIPLEAATNYRISFLIAMACSATSGYRWQARLTSAMESSLCYGWVATPAGLASYSVLNTTNFAEISRTSGASAYYPYHGTIAIRTVAACNLDIFWAQSTSDTAQTAALKRGSWVIVEKIS